MILDGVIVGMFAFGLGLAAGVGVVLYFWARQDTRDGEWARIVEQLQRQNEQLVEYIADIEEGETDEADAASLWGQG